MFNCVLNKETEEIKHVGKLLDLYNGRQEIK